MIRSYKIAAILANGNGALQRGRSIRASSRRTIAEATAPTAAAVITSALQRFLRILVSRIDLRVEEVVKP